MVKIINAELALLEAKLEELNNKLQKGRFVEQVKRHILLTEERIDTLYDILNKAILQGVADKELYN